MTGRRYRVAGFTLPELMVATAVGSLMLGGLMVTSTSLQRWFASAEFVIGCQQDQATVFDYLARDIRRASAFSVANGDRKLVLSVPDLSVRAADATLQLPTLNGSLVQYGTASSTVSYYVQGDSMVREDASGIVPLSTKVDEFHTDLSQPGIARWSLLFKPAPHRPALPPVTGRVFLRNPGGNLQ